MHLMYVPCPTTTTTVCKHEVMEQRSVSVIRFREQRNKCATTTTAVKKNEINEQMKWMLQFLT